MKIVGLKNRPYKMRERMPGEAPFDMPEDLLVGQLLHSNHDFQLRRFARNVLYLLR